MKIKNMAEKNISCKRIRSDIIKGWGAGYDYLTHPSLFISGLNESKI